MRTFLSQITLFCISVGLQESELEDKSSLRVYQRTLMHNILAANANIDWELKYHSLIRKPADPRDECKWRGVQCNEGIISHFLCTTYMIPDYFIRMRMLPSTIQFLHLYQTKVHDGWSAATLPRDLKYVYMSLNFSNQNKADFHRLPHSIEEFHATQQNWYGPIDLRFLPESLELFQLLGRMYCSPVVDTLHISPNLKRVSIIAWEGSIVKRLETVHGERVNKRIFKFQRGSNFHLSDSKYWHFMNGELQSIFTIWQHTEM